jgi:hypothetical protein
MEKHLAVVKGRKERKVYNFGKTYEYDWLSFIYETAELIEETHLWDGELNLPLLHEGDTLLIDELDLEVVITRRLLSTTGEYIYETDHVELIEDVWTEESKIVAEEKLQEYEQQQKEFRKKQDEYVPEYDSSFKANCRAWLKKWFGD